LCLKLFSDTIVAGCKLFHNVDTQLAKLGRPVDGFTLGCKRFPLGCTALVDVLKQLSGRMSTQRHWPSKQLNAELAANAGYEE